MGRSVESPSDGSVASEPGGDPSPEPDPTGHAERRQEPGEPPREQMTLVNDRVAPMSEHERLLAKVRKLEVELERYRKHAQRTSKLFLSVTNYVDWVRESARRDAELALRKARARVEKLNKTAIELERAEDELARVRHELAHLQHLADATRERLSAFLTLGLQALHRDDAAAQDDSPDLALSDLQATLRTRLTSTSASTALQTTEPEDPAL